MKTNIKKIIESLGLLAISAALWQVVLFPIANTINQKIPLSVGENSYIFIALSALLLLINWYATKQGYLDWKNFQLDKETRKWLFFGILATFFLHFLATFIGQLEGIPYIEENPSSEGYILMIDIMTSLLLAPVVEELVFRKILTTVILPKRLELSLLVTGVIFAAIHLPVTIGDWVNQLGAAAILSIIYFKTKKVEATILTHTFMNLFLTSIFWWGMYH